MFVTYKKKTYNKYLLSTLQKMFHFCHAAPPPERHAAAGTRNILTDNTLFRTIIIIYRYTITTLCNR